ncbi:hypothetical protein AALP_AA8G244800 [Arabis alpina]|uniref:Uncharacterized protein n=1 Tax=Arabis alpina TaxID=50452 RepID=A0A087G957_ARAAL|nr:hypothetical protein AALP_AA8G244800 [Arabis alpina]
MVPPPCLPISPSLVFVCLLRWSPVLDYPMEKENSISVISGLALLQIWFFQSKGNTCMSLSCLYGTDLLSVHDRRSIVPFSTNHLTSMVSSTVHYRITISGFLHSSPSNPLEARPQQKLRRCSYHYLSRQNRTGSFSLNCYNHSTRRNQCSLPPSPLRLEISLEWA